MILLIVLSTCEISSKMSVKKCIQILCTSCVLSLFLQVHVVESSIDIYDYFGRKIDSFQDREATFDDDDFMSMEGFVVAATPIDACNPLVPPTFLTNFTIGKFVLVNGSETCGFTKKVLNAQEAGYDFVIIFDPFPMPFEFLRVVSYPKIEINIQVVFISFKDGMTIKENYLYNNSYADNFKVKIKPNTPDITYYMYLFGAIIGVCFFVMLLFMMCLLIKCIQERRRLRRNRLSSRQIRQIPTAKFAKGDQYDVCAICLEDYNEGEKLRILPCSHAYHAKCIDPWLMNNRRNCPLCKRKITFGDSGDESDSDDSEMTSPAENTPLLAASHPGSSSDGATYVRSIFDTIPPDRRMQGYGSADNTTRPASNPETGILEDPAVQRVLHARNQRIAREIEARNPQISDTGDISGGRQRTTQNIGSTLGRITSALRRQSSEEEPLLPPVRLSVNNTSSQSLDEENTSEQGNDLIV